MKIKLLSLIVLITLGISCKKTQEDSDANVIEENIKQEVSKNDISNLDFIEYTIDDKTETVIENWQEYFELADVVDNVKEGDLSFFKDNDSLINSLFKNLKEKSPTTIVTPSITARMLALETKFYKLESLSNLSTTSKEELNSTIKEFLVSFSYLNLQMNKKIEDDSQNIEKPQ